jgi:choline dehydrogenase
MKMGRFQIGARWAVAAWLASLPAVSIDAAEPRPFDYVIVGAGAAGSVVASRLTEDPHVSVLVVEAGGPDTDARIHQPSSFRALPGSGLDWQYATEDEAGLGQRKVPWPRGRVWGGSGSINAMVYVRGHPRDFDRWAEAGNPGWTFAGVLPFFKKAENQERGPSRYHGTGGPQNVADPRWVSPISQAFLAAAQEIGLPRNEDFNGERQEGAGLYQLNQKNGERHSTAAAYLRPALRRENLTVVSHALATRILFAGSRAVGIEYVRRRETHEVRASREVILCAGTIGSPQLLMLSGVGPAEQLTSRDIPVIRELPGVGRNLQDHPRVAVTYRSTGALALTDPDAEERARREYVLSRSGPLSSNGVGAGVFTKTSPDLPAPDLQLFLTANAAQGTFSIQVALMHPASRGEIALRSGAPHEHPSIRANYLSDEGDLDRLVVGVAVARRIAAAAALKSYRGEELGPGPEALGGVAIRDYVREHATTFYHPVGTCRMGSDPMAVVDDELRVHGLDGLRVIDASVMPSLISGATHAATVMIAEKGADLIKRGW